ncbi:hypothetical protein OJF2_69980 [Aquisphaera giovannonii]|uniref:DUF433 domain-containing protein n=1 Tax=Aquisphaera giovannonii TaxID=406548 RepID=A0A5B9WD05_9BACT|nr:DUF433 domain-containing protein [Aquisphaera giovannonii]QEH38397.1 hypothetical protein OJF2_69980 [Aquisphaera giovannonii]
MPRHEDIVRQIAELDPVDREELLIQLGTLPPFGWSGHPWRYWPGLPSFPSIVRTPDVCGGSARLIRTRAPVWTLERMRQLGISDADILSSSPRLQAADLVQAWAYADQHREEIEKEIRENEEE